MKITRRKFLKFLGIGSVSAFVGIDTVNAAETKQETNYKEKMLDKLSSLDCPLDVQLRYGECSEPVIEDYPVKIITEEMYNAIWTVFVDVYSRAASCGMPTDTIKLFARSDILEAMGLSSGDTIYISFFNQTYFLPVVCDNSLKEYDIGNGEYQSDIEIYSPDWKNL